MSCYYAWRADVLHEIVRYTTHSKNHLMHTVHTAPVLLSMNGYRLTRNGTREIYFRSLPEKGDMPRKSVYAHNQNNITVRMRVVMAMGT